MSAFSAPNPQRALPPQPVCRSDDANARRGNAYRRRDAALATEARRLSAAACHSFLLTHKHARAELQEGHDGRSDARMSFALFMCYCAQSVAILPVHLSACVWCVR